LNRLLIRPGAIGDCLLSFPALEHLKTDYTEVWVPSAVVPLVWFADQVRPLASTGIDLLGIGEVETPARLREQLAGFDEIVSWYGYKRPEFRAALQQINPRCVFHAALPEGGTHATDFFAWQVGATDGLCTRLQLETSTRHDAVVIHPFSGGTSKNWPLDYFRSLAEQLPCQVEWIAGPEQELEGALRFESLRDLAEHLSGARLYIGNDSGITHLAAAAGVPGIALFGPTEPDIWTPRGEHVIVLRGRPMETLTVATVLQAAIHRLHTPDNRRRREAHSLRPDSTASA
jgi:ADP-heptose:LPS heptosyltransferase